MSPAGFEFDARARLAEIRARRAAHPTPPKPPTPEADGAGAVGALGNCRNAADAGNRRVAGAVGTLGTVGRGAPAQSAAATAPPSARPTRPGRTFSFEEVLSHDWDPGPEGEALRAEAVAMVEAAANPDLFAPRCQAWAAFFEAEKRAEADRRGRGHLATALAFLKTGWAERAMAAGWEEIQLFGLHQTRPWDRFDNMEELADAPPEMHGACRSER